jgi:hydrogenase maturation protease
MRGLRAKIIGLGQNAAGDDGVGLAVARRLVTQRLPEGVMVIEQAEPSALITELFDGADCVVLVDAMVDGGESGRVVQIDLNETDPGGSRLLSTHGIGLLEAIALARTLNEGAMPRRIAIVGITISQPARYGTGLSEAAAAAVARAAQLALDLATA